MAYQKEILRDQFMFLNRILLFTHKYEIGTYSYINTPIYKKQYVKNGKIIKKEKIYDYKKSDTTKIRLPTFATDNQKRSQFLEDINYIKSNKDKIDHTVYVKFEKILAFIDNHKIPSDNNDMNSMMKSEWKEEEIIKEWDELTDDLYQVTIRRVHFEF